jgi:hypothetical protein
MQPPGDRRPQEEVQGVLTFGQIFIIVTLPFPGPVWPVGTASCCGIIALIFLLPERFPGMRIVSPSAEITLYDACTALGCDAMPKTDGRLMLCPRRRICTWTRRTASGQWGGPGGGCANTGASTRGTSTS